MRPRRPPGHLLHALPRLWALTLLSVVREKVFYLKIAPWLPGKAAALVGARQGPEDLGTLPAPSAPWDGCRGSALFCRTVRLSRHPLPRSPECGVAPACPGSRVLSSRGPGQCRSWREGRTSERGADVCGRPAPTRTHWLLLRAGAWGLHGVSVGSPGPRGWDVGPEGGAPCTSVSSLEGERLPSGAQGGRRHSEEALLKTPATPRWRGRWAPSSEAEDTG